MEDVVSPQPPDIHQFYGDIMHQRQDGVSAKLVDVTTVRIY